MNESTQVLLGLGVGLGAGIAIAATQNPSLLSAADAIAPVGTLCKQRTERPRHRSGEFEHRDGERKHESSDFLRQL